MDSEKWAPSRGSADPLVELQRTHKRGSSASSIESIKSIRRRFRSWPRRILLLVVAAGAAYALASFTNASIEDGAVVVRLREHPKMSSDMDTHLKVKPAALITDYKVLASNRNPYGMINMIDVDGLNEKTFNPTLIELPKGSRHQFLVIIRLRHVGAKVGDGAGGERFYALARQEAFFADIVVEETTGRPYLKRANKWSKPVLDGFPVPLSRCLLLPGFARMIGPEDVRVFWTREGAPLLIFAAQSPVTGECLSTFMIDARAAIPELQGALKGASLPPIRFKKPRQLRRHKPGGLELSPDYEREKNWEPFQTGFGDSADDLYFSAQLVEPRMYKFEELRKFVQYVGPAKYDRRETSSPAATHESYLRLFGRPATHKRELVPREMVVALDAEAEAAIEEAAINQANSVAKPATTAKQSEDAVAEPKAKPKPKSSNPFVDDSAPEGPAPAGLKVSALETPKAQVKPKFDSSYPFDVSEEENYEHLQKSQSCVHDIMQSSSGVHQATPLLRVTLCDRGECTPDIHNTVLFGMVHRLHSSPYRWYDRRIVTWNVTSPFEYRSVSKRLVYTGAKYRDFIWTGSMTYYWNGTTPKDRSHGYLDDEVWFGFGIADDESGWLDVNARQLVEDHYYCQGAPAKWRV